MFTLVEELFSRLDRRGLFKGGDLLNYQRTTELAWKLLAINWVYERVQQ